MSEAGKEVHDTFCSHMINKAKNNIVLQKTEAGQPKQNGIKTSGMSKNELIKALASQEVV